MSRDILRRVQEDCYGRCLAEPLLSTIAIILERRAVTAQEVQKLLSARAARGGKVGVCILVQRPIFIPEADNSALRGQLIQAFTIIEHPTLNAGDLGTGYSAEEIGADILQLFAFSGCSSPQQVFSPLPGGALVPDDSFEGFNTWEARLQTFVAIPRMERVGLPLISPDSGSHSQAITLTSATSGAALYSTKDGSYPSSANPTAMLYTAPFVLPAAATLRVAGEKFGLQQSNIAQATFS